MSVLFGKVLSLLRKRRSPDTSTSNLPTIPAKEVTATRNLDGTPVNASETVEEAAAPSDPHATPAPEAYQQPDLHAAPVLDAAAFPHLVERIVTHASFEPLLAIRLCCRHLRSLADDCLPRHISFESDGTIPVKSTDAGGRTVWTLAPFLPAAVRMVDLRIWPGDYNVPGSCKCLRGNHRVDHIHRIGPRIPSLDLLRVRADQCTYAAVGEHLTAETCVVVIGSEGREDAVPVYPPTQCWKKLVICIMHRPGEDLPLKAFELPGRDALNSVSEVVVTYSQRSVGPNHPQTAMATPQHPVWVPQQICKLSLRLAAQCLSARNGKATLVDTTSWSPVLLNDLGMTAGADVTEVLKEFVRERIADQRYWRAEITKEASYQLVNNLSFPSLDEYRARVGEEQFALEMCLDWEERVVIHNDEV